MFLAFLFGAFGAIVAEVLKRWQQWNEMPEKRFLALLKSIEFWAITVFLILLGGSVGVFEGTKTHPIDWSLSMFLRRCRSDQHRTQFSLWGGGAWGSARETTTA